MNSNYKIKRRLKKEIEESVPDVFPAVIEQLKIDNNTTVIPIESYKKRKNSYKKLISIAAAIAVVFTTLFAFAKNSGNTFDIEFDVNPGIILEVNDNYKVVDVETLNDDAVYVLDSMDLKGSNLNVAVNAIMYSIIKNGYIDEMTNSVLVSVGYTDSTTKDKVSESITNQINTAFSENAIEGSVLIQTMETSDEIAKMAQKHKITIGKASLIKHLIDSGKTTYTADSLANLSINELNLILSAKNATENITVYGHPSTKAYIGESVAKDISFKAAGIDVKNVKHSSCELDLEDGIIVYDVEFIVPGAIYECEIDALTGEVCDLEAEPVDDLYREEMSTNLESNPTIVLKSKEDIKNIVLSYAGINPADCSGFAISLEYDDSFAKYEVDFIYDNEEYEYEVNAIDGSILSFSHEKNTASSDVPVTEIYAEDYTIDSSTNSVSEYTDSSVQVTEPSESAVEQNSIRIGKEEAIKIALTHAGLSKIDNIETETEFGFNNGIVYNIEFKYNNYEYEYEINAHNGEIVDFEKEYDD